MKENTQNAKVDDWVKAVCDIDDKMTSSWAAYFKSKNLFELVIKDLNTFCDARVETARYRPLAGIFTKILEMARGASGGMVGIGSCPPLDDLCFVPHDGKVMRRQEHQGKLAASRKPDIVATRKKEVQSAQDMDKGLEWSAAVIAYELKQEFLLRPQFDVECKRRGIGNSTSGTGDEAPIPESKVRTMLLDSGLLHRI